MFVLPSWHSKTLSVLEYHIKRNINLIYYYYYYHPRFRPRLPLRPQIKPWAELSRAVQLYFCFTLASMCVLLGLTLASFFGQYDALLEQDLGVSLIQLVGICECHGNNVSHSNASSSGLNVFGGVVLLSGEFSQHL